MKRINLNFCVGIGVFLGFLFVYSVVAYFHSSTMRTSGLAVIAMIGVWSSINWAVVFKSSTDARNKKFDALDEKLNLLLEQQER